MTREPVVIHLPVPEGADIEDDAVLWRAWREYWRGKRRDNLKYWEEVGKDQIKEMIQDVVTRFSEHHYAIFVGSEERIDIWPSSRKWRYKGKTSQGDFPAMFNFIRKRSRKENT